MVSGKALARAEPRTLPPVWPEHAQALLTADPDPAVRAHRHPADLARTGALDDSGLHLEAIGLDAHPEQAGRRRDPEPLRSVDGQGGERFGRVEGSPVVLDSNDADAVVEQHAHVTGHPQALALGQKRGHDSVLQVWRVDQLPAEAIEAMNAPLRPRPQHRVGGLGEALDDVVGQALGGTLEAHSLGPGGGGPQHQHQPSDPCQSAADSPAGAHHEG